MPDGNITITSNNASDAVFQVSSGWHHTQPVEVSAFTQLNRPDVIQCHIIESEQQIRNGIPIQTIRASTREALNINVSTDAELYFCVSTKSFYTLGAIQAGDYYNYYILNPAPIEAEPVMYERYIETNMPTFDFEQPFLHFNGGWHVIISAWEPYWYEGEMYYSSAFGQNYRLAARVSDSFFGFPYAHRIIWEEEDDDVYEAYEDEESYDEELYDRGYSEEREDIDSSSMAPRLTASIGREIPLVSFEQEFSGMGEMVAQKLHAAGYSYAPFVEGYHSSEGRYNSGNSRFCYIETDSSCGYELIFDRVNLRNAAQAEKISEVQKILKQMKNDGVIRLDARCGFHTHIDVSHWVMKDLVSGYHLWNYLEDLTFRFGSAFWPSHRDEETGNSYSTPVRKGLDSRITIGRELARRRDALNFAPILNARAECSCGASLYEDWANCRCNSRQPTIEFRVFNATLNQRKIKAYLAFCVAFVNMAAKVEHNPVDFPEMRWIGTTSREMGLNGESWEERTAERINYVLNEFPLTNAEKTDIMYCFKNSSLEPVLETI